MNSKTRCGFAFLVTLVLLSLAGVALIVMTTAANSMVADNHRALIDAGRRNMIASGAAWYRHNRSTVTAEALWAGVELDTKDLNMPQGYLRVALPKDAKTADLCEITTHFQIGRIKVEKSQIVNASPTSQPGSPATRLGAP